MDANAGKLPLTQENIEQVWAKFMLQEHLESLFISAAKQTEILLDSNNVIRFKVHGITNLGLLQLNKLDINSYFSKYIIADPLLIEFDVVEVAEEPKDAIPSTMRGKFEYLLNEYPAFARLVKEIDLDIVQ